MLFGSFRNVQTNKPLKAVVWDMDGMIFDTERLSFVAWQAGAKSIGLEIDLPLFQSLIGMNSESIKRRLITTLGNDADVLELTRVASLEYDKLISKGPPLKAGARQCIELLKLLQVPQALATSSSRRYAERKLSHHALLDEFNAIVTGDQVSQGKPHPEPYLLAAERLSVDPACCIAFEDSVNGIASAYGAGMHTVLILDMCPHDEDSLSKVCEQFDTLEHALPFLEATFR